MSVTSPPSGEAASLIAQELDRPLEFLAAVVRAARALQLGEMERLVDIAPFHLRSLVVVAVEEAAKVASDNADAFEFLKIGRQLEQVINRRCSLERKLDTQRRHALRMEGERANLRQAIFEHFKRTMATGVRPSPSDLELWAKRGIDPDGWWPTEVEVQAPPSPLPDPIPASHFRWAREAMQQHAGELWVIPKPEPKPEPPKIVTGHRGVPVCATSGKLCFDSSETAAKFRKLTRRHSASERSIRSYLCPHCDTWHNTSQAAFRPCPEA